MSYLLCEKHNKIEKTASKIPVNGLICLNRYCPESFKVFCATCKTDHRDHAVKVLTIEDVSFLVDRLLKTPFKQVAKYVGEALDVMKKLKLIKEFRKKFDLLQKEIQKQALRLVDSTESLIHEYSLCKKSVSNLQQYLVNIEQIQTYDKFIANSKDLLSNLDYNFKKDKFQYSNTMIRQKEDKRKKTYEHSKRKIEEVKDYSMKIIEVILHNDDSSEDQEDFAYIKKHYQLLKKELCLEKNQLELDSEISELKNSNSTTNKSRIKKGVSAESQTLSELFSREQIAEELDSKLHQVKISHQRIQNDLRLKCSVVARQKQSINRELAKMKQKYEEKNKKIKEIQQTLRKKHSVKLQKQVQRESLFNHILQLSQWKGLCLQDRYD